MCDLEDILAHVCDPRALLSYISDPALLADVVEGSKALDVSTIRDVATTLMTLCAQATPQGFICRSDLRLLVSLSMQLKAELANISIAELFAKEKVTRRLLEVDASNETRVSPKRDKHTDLASAGRVAAIKAAAIDQRAEVMALHDADLMGETS